MKTYQVNEVFLSLQGEGHRAGSANVFVRLAGCNLTCSRDSEAGFDCDTEFVSGLPSTAADLLAKCGELAQACRAVIFTGGEPLLQLDAELVAAFKAAGWMVCVETNGTLPVPDGVDWVSCSPKSAEHTLRAGKVSELRYVRHAGQGIPRPVLAADHFFLSPACGPGGFDPTDMAHCVALAKANPPWRLSLQQHKLWGVR
jgi:organic radical activating enzyme